MVPHLWTILCVGHKERQKCWLYGPEHSKMICICWGHKETQNMLCTTLQFGQNNTMRTQEACSFLVCILTKGEEPQREQPMQNILPLTHSCTHNCLCFDLCALRDPQTARSPKLKSCQSIRTTYLDQRRFSSCSVPSNLHLGCIYLHYAICTNSFWFA